MVMGFVWTPRLTRRLLRRSVAQAVPQIQARGVFRVQSAVVRGPGAAAVGVMSEEELPQWRDLMALNDDYGAVSSPATSLLTSTRGCLWC